MPVALFRVGYVHQRPHILPRRAAVLALDLLSGGADLSLITQVYASTAAGLHQASDEAREAGLDAAELLSDLASRSDMIGEALGGLNAEVDELNAAEVLTRLSEITREIDGLRSDAEALQDEQAEALEEAGQDWGDDTEEEDTATNVSDADEDEMDDCEL